MAMSISQKISQRFAIFNTERKIKNGIVYKRSTVMRDFFIYSLMDEGLFYILNGEGNKIIKGRGWDM
jgi:hypothetical protein